MGSGVTSAGHSETPPETEIANRAPDPSLQRSRVGGDTNRKGRRAEEATSRESSGCARRRSWSQGRRKASHRDIEALTTRRPVLFRLPERSLWAPVHLQVVADGTCCGNASRNFNPKPHAPKCGTRIRLSPPLGVMEPLSTACQRTGRSRAQISNSVESLASCQCHHTPHNGRGSNYKQIAKQIHLQFACNQCCQHSNPRYRQVRATPESANTDEHPSTSQTAISSLLAADPLKSAGEAASSLPG